MSTPSANPPGRRMHLGEMMLLVAGVAVGLWLVMPTDGGMPKMGALEGGLLLWASGVLGGLSVVGPLLLLHERRQRHRRSGRREPWGAGRFLWFSSGTAAWLLWPPVVFLRVSHGRSFGDSSSGVCFAYGTPLMALYVVAALVAGGWLRRSRRRRLRRSWRERFGLILGLLWACTGLYVLALLYAEDLRR